MSKIRVVNWVADSGQHEAGQRPPEMTVQSHRDWPDMVVVEIGKEKREVYGQHLIDAVKNAMNTSVDT